MNRLTRWIDPLFGTAFAAAVTMAVLTALLGALPAPARAAERLLGNGEAVTEQRAPGDFDAVQTHGVDVVVRQGGAPAATVRADGNLVALLETVVEDGAQGRTLVVRWKRGVMLDTRVSPRVTVTAVQLGGLAIRGSGDLVGEALKVTRLVARVEGSGDLRLNGLVADELALAIQGSGDMVASGQARRLAISIAGSGDVKAEALKADDVSVNIAGSGDAAVHAERLLTVSIAGSGDVVYSGNASVKRTVAGSGSVTRR